MRKILFAIVFATLAVNSLAQAGGGAYKVLKTAKVGGPGGFDYVFADSEARRLYIARTGPMSRMTVYNLDTLEPAGEIATTNSHGAVIDEQSGHGFISSKPVQMFDTKTMKAIKRIEVQGSPDGMLADQTAHRIYVFSHSSPNVTVLEAKDGSIVGTLDIGGEPEQAVSDGKGHIYIDVEDKENIAIVDSKTLMVTGHYDLAGKGGTCSGLAIDAKSGVLFTSCRNPANMVILNASDGKILTTLPIGMGTDGALFNPKTMEAFSSQGDGTLTVVKEKGPADFAVEQTVQTMAGARTSTLDSKTNHIITIAAEFGPPTPPAQPGGRAGRGALLPDSFTILVVGK